MPANLADNQNKEEKVIALDMAKGKQRKKIQLKNMDLDLDIETNIKPGKVTNFAEAKNKTEQASSAPTTSNQGENLSRQTEDDDGNKNPSSNNNNSEKNSQDPTLSPEKATADEAEEGEDEKNEEGEEDENKNNEDKKGEESEGGGKDPDLETDPNAESNQQNADPNIESNKAPETKDTPLTSFDSQKARDEKKPKEKEEPQPDEQQSESPEDQSRIASMLNSTKFMKKRQIKKQIKKEQKELEDLEKETNDIMASPAFSILKWIPGLGASIENAFRGLKDTTNISGLTTAVRSMQTIKGLLLTSRTTGGIIDGIKLWAQIFVATIETIVIPVFMVFLFPIFVIFFAIVPVGEIAKAIDKVLKRVNKILEKLKTKLTLAKRKRQKRIKINQLKVALKNPNQYNQEQNQEKDNKKENPVGNNLTNINQNQPKTPSSEGANFKKAA